MKDTALPGPVITRGISDRQESTTYYPSESMVDGKTREFFWGCVLTKEHPTTSWNFVDEEDEKDFLEHTLFLKQATLGTGIEDNVRHIVSVETKNFAGDEITQPIINLTSGKQDMAMLDLIFQYEIPVTFRLVEGTGPIHLSASQLVEFPAETELDETETEFEETGTEDDLMGEEDDDDDDAEVDEEEELEERGKKRKALKRGNKSKRGRVERLPSPETTEESSEPEEGDDSMEDDSDMESEEESEYEVTPPRKLVKKPKGKKKVASPKSKKRGRLSKPVAKKTKGKNK